MNRRTFIASLMAVLPTSSSFAKTKIPAEIPIFNTKHDLRFE